MRTALTIAGADPSGGAGIQADLKVFEAFGIKGLSAITALTAQDGHAVHAVLPVPPEFLLREITVLLKKYRVDAVKVGMLGTGENAIALAGLFKKTGLKNIVLDTVLASTGGRPLIDEGGAGAVKKLLKYACIVTPNLREASILTGMDIGDLQSMEEAARSIHSLGARSVLVKGGHLAGNPVDVLFDGKRFDYFKGRRLKGNTERFHGTGCILSAGIAASLAKGRGVKKAVEEARERLASILKKR
ncbi:MAG: bifunctional hydroxymethylpyrimidine kinase/phosphomethylpyrimidine kinase [Deltaproteobacteria bacterium GWC2_56_8]|nr:MAG: bifunctional hydroxymethylpyrimidine kinase/phosphomethylpyrimidine kinase [Deltaproteobacteria bacterium GWB2_55_19]OGP36219.1 MAG: bifunctional hydroxymethylpyrimidine kinase/phosphomethylpyrimidine kinase [Deltaproteobacteria bacterium GWC2_56_8]HAO94195.1 bifunctional hydroxymethylpyrimidine kinase/phosphomethylpyrimidine kinase [Deltaproteobacteria bacterium]